MRAKVVLTLIILILLFIAIYAAVLVLGSPRAEAPASNFRGPTGVPYVKGPPGPPQ